MSRAKNDDALQGRGALIAVIGCDGSGKSTISSAVATFAERFGPVMAVHLGKQSGNIARRVARWPLLGRRLDRKIDRETVKSRGTHSKGNPSFLGALVVYAFVLRRRRRFNRMLAQRQDDTIVVADRFPQIDVPGAYDGPILSPDRPGGRIVHWLARRERLHFAWMAGHSPDLVIRLHVDLETAIKRKPDHKVDSLRRKIEATPRFTFNGATIVEIDSTQPLSDVIAQAETAVEQLLVEKGYREEG